MNTKQTIKVKNVRHLKELILDSPLDADLNHLDVSDLVIMSGAFMGSSFNGDISEWKTPNL